MKRTNGKFPDFPPRFPEVGGRGAVLPSGQGPRQVASCQAEAPGRPTGARVERDAERAIGARAHRTRQDPRRWLSAMRPWPPFRRGDQNQRSPRTEAEAFIQSESSSSPLGRRGSSLRVNTTTDIASSGTANGSTANLLGADTADQTQTVSSPKGSR